MINPLLFFPGIMLGIPTPDINYNHLYEEMPPLNRWGRKFITVPLQTRTMDYYRVLASQDNTIVSIGSMTLPPMKKGEYYEFSRSDPQLIESNNAVLLAQFSSSQNNDSGAPFEMIVNPVTETTEKVEYTPIWTTNSAKPYINIVVEDSVGTD